MRKKLKLVAASFALTLSMAFSALPAFAENGPMDKADEYGNYYTYLNFAELDEEGYVNYNGIKSAFSNNAVQNEMEGAVYDRESNTLTLTNLKADNVLLEANMMGDDFKVKVVGDCTLGKINVWGDGWGGSLTIEGDGTLTVNENKLFDNALVLYPEGCDVSVNFAKGVTVKLYAKKDAALVAMVKDDSAENLFTFANGQKADIVKDNYKYQMTKWVGTYTAGKETETSPIIISCSDESAAYAASYGSYTDSEGNTEEGIFIKRYIYSEKFGVYFQDRNFGESGRIFMTEEEFKNSEYKIDSYEEGEPVKYNEIKVNEWYGDYQLYKGQDGKEYTIGFEYTDGEMAEVVYSLEEIPEFEGKYVITPSADVSKSDLEPLYEEVVNEGVYNYTLTGTSFIYDGTKEVQENDADNNSSNEDNNSSKDNSSNSNNEGKAEYSIISEAGSQAAGNTEFPNAWKQGSEEGLLIISEAPFDKFQGVIIDGQTIDPSYYTAVEGSTRITLKKEYLSTLSLGTHDIIIRSTDGDAKTTFTILDAAGNITANGGNSNNNAAGSANNTSTSAAPKTGDSNDAVLWLGLMGAAMLGAAGVGYTRKKNNISE